MSDEDASAKFKTRCQVIEVELNRQEIDMDLSIITSRTEVIYRQICKCKKTRVCKTYVYNYFQCGHLNVNCSKNRLCITEMCNEFEFNVISLCEAQMQIKTNRYVLKIMYVMNNYIHHKNVENVCIGVKKHLRSECISFKYSENYETVFVKIWEISYCRVSISPY